MLLLEVAAAQCCWRSPRRRRRGKKGEGGHCHRHHHCCCWAGRAGRKLTRSRPLTATIAVVITVRRCLRAGRRPTVRTRMLAEAAAAAARGEAQVLLLLLLALTAALKILKRAGCRRRSRASRQKRGWDERQWQRLRRPQGRQLLQQEEWGLPS